MANKTAIVGGTVIDATGAAPAADSTIIISDGKIEQVGPSAQVQVPEGATVIDAKGKYLIPGLMDANVHLVSARTPDTILEFEDRYENLVQEAAELTLKYGTTTVFDTWGPAKPTAAVRDRINAGEAIGSRIYLAGNIIGLNGPLSDDFFNPGNTLEPATLKRINSLWEEGTGRDLALLTLDELSEAIEAYIAETKVDFLKYAANDHGASGKFLVFSEAMQRRIVEVGRAHGMSVQAHTMTIEGLRMEIEAGADLLQHADATIGKPIPQEILDVIVERQLPIAGLLVTDAFLDWSKQQSDMMSDMRSIMDINARNFVEQGAKLMLTTDGFAYGQRVKNHPGFRPGLRDTVPDMPSMLGASHFFWIKAAFEKGMDPMEVLRSSTSHIADAYKVSDKVGTLVAGKIADILVLTANPLESPDNYRQLETVIKDGKVVDRAALGQNRLLADDPLADTVKA